MLRIHCVGHLSLRKLRINSINTLSVTSDTWGKKLCNSPLQTPVRQPASQQAATAVSQLPGAPGMQREPRRAAAQACVREQRALSVPRKQPRGDFNPIGPSATAAGGARLGLRREPRDGTLRGSSEKTLCYEAFCSVKPHRA